MFLQNTTHLHLATFNYFAFIYNNQIEQSYRKKVNMRFSDFLIYCHIVRYYFRKKNNPNIYNPLAQYIMDSIEHEGIRYG